MNIHRLCFHRTAAVLGLAMVLHPSSHATAQSFPSNNVRVVVAAGPGTPPDIISRIVATELQQSEGWRVVVENKVGAMQTIAGAEVLKQPADGHNLVSVSLPGMTAPALLPNASINMEADFTPVVKLSTSYNVLVVHPSVPVKTMTELVALLKKEPDKFTYASGGFGTPAHLAGELFKLRTGVRATHVPYQQLPQAIGGMVGGTHQYMFVTTLPVINLIGSGQLRALAVTSPSRLAALPDVPTVVEAGFPEIVVQDWVGYLAKSGTPAPIVSQINQAVNKALAKPAVKDAMAKLGAAPAGGSPTEFNDFVRSQLAYWTAVVRDSGMKMHQ